LGGVIGGILLIYSARYPTLKKFIDVLNTIWHALPPQGFLEESPHNFCNTTVEKIWLVVFSTPHRQQFLLPLHFFCFKLTQFADDLELSIRRP
jgi:hypothetical protein